MLVRVLTLAKGFLMMRLVFWLFLLIISIAAALFAVSNRTPVELGFWPFPVAISAPIYLVTLSALGVGLLFGWALGWLAAAKSRRERRRLAKALAACEAELADARAAKAKEIRPVGQSLSVHRVSTAA